jgi:Fe-S-cluster containining protein
MRGGVMSNTCAKCEALCCKYFALEIDTPTTRNDFENIRWYISHQKTSVFIQERKWYLNVKNRCKHLKSDNRCKIYEERPAICRRLHPDNCEYHDRNAVREIKTLKQLGEYLEEKPIRKKRK